MMRVASVIDGRYGDRDSDIREKLRIKNLNTTLYEHLIVRSLKLSCLG